MIRNCLLLQSDISEYQCNTGPSYGFVIQNGNPKLNRPINKGGKSEKCLLCMWIKTLNLLYKLKTHLCVKRIRRRPLEVDPFDASV